MDHEYDVLGGYIPSFVQHLEDTRARLGLRIGSETNEERASVEDATEDAKLHTYSSWTPAEQDAFFRAVSVHSRWRPDLIAACVPTKTEWEVWMYLEALEEGAAALAVHESDGDEDEDGEMELGGGRNAEMNDDVPASDSRSRSGSHMDEDTGADEDVCEPALEVSQAWVDVEERMAAWIVDAERLASVGGDGTVDTAHSEERPRKRKRGRPRKASGEVVPNKGRGSLPPVRCSPTPERTRAHERSEDASIVPERKCEALMGRLEVSHLLVLDSILRGGEEATKTKDRGKSREGSVTAATLWEHGDNGAPGARDVGTSSLSDRVTGPHGASHFPCSPSSAVIDPALLALSGGVDHPTRHQSNRLASQSTAMNCAPAEVSSSLPNTSPREFSQPGTSNMTAFPQDNAALTNPDLNANAEAELSLFSPRSRRRIQKRLYMRRKRALLRGENVGSKGSLDPGIERLRPGKKAKPEQRETSIASTSVPCSESPSDVEADLPENASKKNKPGLTLPYKLKVKFAELGVDEAYLRGQGMDLLNLGALGRLMGLYSSLEHGEEETDELATVESIDALLIRHLQAAMISFVTDVMHRAIVWREREIRLKQRSRVWRHSDQFTIGAVEHAVATIGARYHSHKAYFKLLEAFHGLSSEASSAPGNATEEPNARDASVDPDVGAEDLSAELPGLSPHRDVYTPLVCPPPAWRTSPLACLAQTYEREATRTRRGTSAEIDEDELMSDETDEEALEAELAGEEERDARDTALSATHEEGLWAGTRLDK